MLAKITERGIAFAAPDQRIAVFTDDDLAGRFKQDLHADDSSFVILPIPSARVLSGFFSFVSDDYIGIAVDPDQQKTIVFGFPGAIDALSRQDS